MGAARHHRSAPAPRSISHRVTVFVRRPLLTTFISFEDYVNLPGEHFSGLKALDTSPLHYHRAVAKKDTSALRIGRTLHAFVLDPDGVDYVVWEGGDKKGAAWKAFAEKHSTSTILKPEDLERALGMRRALTEHPIAGPLLAKGLGEVTLVWEAEGIECKARLDWLLPDDGLLELKTTRKIRPESFAREVASRLYHVQLAFYSGGLEAMRKRRPPRHVVVAVENEQPFDVAVYSAGEDVLEAGRRKVDGWLRTLRECRASGRWPGVGGDELIDLKLPDWALTDGLEEVDLVGLGEAESDG